jgi:hypothetical protein
MGFPAVDFFIGSAIGADATLEELDEPVGDPPLLAPRSAAGRTIEASLGHGPVLVGDFWHFGIPVLLESLEFRHQPVFQDETA